MNLEDIAKKENFLSAFSEKNRIEILKIGRLKSYKKRDIVFLEGDNGVYFYLLSSGNVQLSKTSADGKEIVIKVIRPGEIFAEVVLFEQDKYPVNATAIDACEIFLFSKNEFLSLLDNRDLRNEFIRTLLKKQRYLAEQIKYLTIYDVEDRFYKFLNEQYGKNKEISITLSKKDIAAAIGSTPETFSRLIQRLTDENKIEWDGKLLRLLKK